MDLLTFARANRAYNGYHVRHAPRNLVAQMMAKNKVDTITNFTDMSNVTVNAGSATLVQEPDNPVYTGTNSLKVTPTGSDIARIVITFTTPRTFNYDFLGMMVYQPGLPKADGYIEAVFISSHVVVGKATRPKGGAISGTSNSWVLVEFPITTGDTPMTTVDRIEITFTFKAGGNTDERTLFVDSIFQIANPLTQGLVTITLDGSYKEAYTQTRPILSKYGYRANAMVVKDHLGTPGKMTLDDVKALEKLGWDISTHPGADNDNLVGNPATMTPEQLNTLALDRQRWLVENGFYDKGGRFILKFNTMPLAEAVSEFSKYFYFIRSAGGGGNWRNNSFPVFNPYAIGSANFINYDNNLTALQMAATHRQWAILIWHPGKDSELTPTEQEQLCEDIKTLGLKVVTFSDVLDDMVLPKVTY